MSSFLQSGKPASHVANLQPAFAQRLEAMLQSAPPGVQIMSGYRSPAHQQALWNQALKKYGSTSAARKWVAPPGHSNHNHGIASDLKFSSQEAKDWVHKNAERFGLRFRMAHEGWHIEPLDAKGDDSQWGRG